MAKPAWYQDDHSGPSLKHQKAPTQTQYNADPNKLHHYAKKAIIVRPILLRNQALLDIDIGNICNRAKLANFARALVRIAVR